MPDSERQAASVVGEIMADLALTGESWFDLSLFRLWRLGGWRRTPSRGADEVSGEMIDDRHIAASAGGGHALTSASG